MKSLGREEYQALKSGAEVTAADPHGDKVLRLVDGTYLKLFRIKRLWTSARLFPYWRRFQRNASRLSALQIPTLRVIDVYDIPHLARTAVHYHPLPGQTLREVASLDGTLLSQLGRFINELHNKGVYLRSMHLGNVVLTPEGQLGLIDIADMTVSGRSLSAGKRLRNYQHLARYEEDRPVVRQYLEDFLAEVSEPLHSQVAELFR